MTTTITFNKFTVQATQAEQIYLKARCFQHAYRFTPLTDPEGKLYSWEIVHDYLHWDLKLSPSEADEAVLADLEREWTESDNAEYNRLMSVPNQETFKRLYALGI
jgi:hypothetical protein